MAFRADEAKTDGYERAQSYLISRNIPDDQKEKSLNKFWEIIDKYGPVVESYPSWHPLVSAKQDDRCPITVPCKEGGYEGLDHTVYLANGFITCPYGDGQQVIDSVEELAFDPIVSVTAERLDVAFYYEGTTPILVYCEWKKPFPLDGTIPKSLAVPLMLEQEVPCWRDAQLAETWETMRPYFLGRPHGSRSSLFLNQETGQTLKNIWNAIIYTGMFGPIKV